MIVELGFLIMASTKITSKTELTPKELIDFEIPDDVLISPSGEQVVYSSSPMGQKGKHKISTLWIAQIGHEKSARQLTSGLWNDRMPQWAPNGESVAFLSDRDDQGKSCAIYLLSIHGGGAYPITKAENERDISTFAWSPNGKFIALLSPDEKARKKEKDDVMIYGLGWECNRLRLIHWATREVEVLYAKDAHVKMFAWSEDSEQIAYVLQENPEDDSAFMKGVSFETLSIFHKSGSKITGFPGTIKGPLLWVDSNLYFLAGVEPSKCNTSSAVYQISLKTKDWSEYPHDPDGDSCVGGLCRNGRLITIKIESGSLDQIYLFHDKAILKNQLIFSDNHKISAWDAVQTINGTYVFVVVKSTVSSPRELYSSQGTWKRRRVQEGYIQLSDHGQSISSRHIGNSQDLHCTSSDGTTELDGLFLSPSVSPPVTNSGRKSLPTVVLIHRGPYSRVTDCFNTSFYHWSPLLLSSGKCGILLPNYRGGSSHGEGFARHARKGMGMVDYDDIIAVVDEGIKRGLVDPEQIIVGGWSHGGFLSYLLAVRRNSQSSPGSNWKIKGAICGAGVTDWDMMSMTSDMPTFGAELAGVAPWLTGRGEGKASITGRGGSAIWEMKGQEIPPILILHGEKDERVPLTQAVAFRRGCQYWEVPFEMAVYPREGHSFKERAHLIDMLKRVSRFCDTCLG